MLGHEGRWVKVKVAAESRGQNTGTASEWTAGRILTKLHTHISYQV